jgi:hypothetical protein
MNNDFDFFDEVGKDVSVYKTCIECEGFYIVNPDIYNKPLAICSENCNLYVPFCFCKDVSLFNDRDLENCFFPDCKNE